MEEYLDIITSDRDLWARVVIRLSLIRLGLETLATEGGAATLAYIAGARLHQAFEPCDVLSRSWMVLRAPQHFLYLHAQEHEQPHPCTQKKVRGTQHDGVENRSKQRGINDQDL